MPFPQLWVRSHGFPLCLSLCFCTLISPHVKNKRLAVKLGRGKRERRFIGELIPILDPAFLCGRRQGPGRTLGSRAAGLEGPQPPPSLCRRTNDLSSPPDIRRVADTSDSCAQDLLLTCNRAPSEAFGLPGFPSFFLRLVGEGWGFGVVGTGLPVGMYLLVSWYLRVRLGNCSSGDADHLTRICRDS